MTKAINEVSIKEEANIVKATERSELVLIMKELKENDVFHNSDGLKIGYIEEIVVRDGKNRETGEAFQMIDINVKTAEGKSLKKTYSLEFTRRFFKQLNSKAKDLFEATVVVKPTGKYKNIGFLAFVTECDGVRNIQTFKDEGDLDNLKRLAQLDI